MFFINRVLSEQRQLLTDLGARTDRIKRSMEMLDTLEDRVEKCRSEMHLLFTEIEVALQAIGFVSAKLRRQPIGGQEAPQLAPRMLDEHSPQMPEADGFAAARSSEWRE